MRGAARLLALATTLGAAAIAFASDRVIRDDAHHFQFERPETWTRCDEKVSDEFGARFAVLTKTFDRSMKAQCDLAFITALGGPCEEDGRRSAYVAAAIQRWSPPPCSYAGLARRYSKEIMDSGALLLEELPLPIGTRSDVVVDRTRGRISWHGTTTIDGVGVVPAYTIGLPGKEGIVWLYAFARPARDEAAWTLVDAIADSFRWDDGYEFHEEVVAGSVSGPRPWRDDANRWSVTIPDG